METASPNIGSVHWGGTKSSSWRDVTLRIQKTGEELKMPVMSCTKVKDVRGMLQMSLGLDSASAAGIEFLAKAGPSLRKLRSGDEIRSHCVVRNLQSFARAKQQYPHPLCIIGAGHFGLRVAMHYQRNQVPDYIVLDRYHRIGGHAWVSHANVTSCTQSEGIHYQLCYDPVDGNTAGLKKDYGCWPSCATILKHFDDVCGDYGVTPHIKLNTNVADMNIVDNEDFVKKRYDLHWDSTAPDSDSSGMLSVSCISVFPGAMVYPRPGSWPGEDDFGGQLEYAHGNLFDYTRIKGENVIIIGCGAFANENIRTSIEFAANHIYMVVRRMNVFLPRCVCWLVNQSINAPPGAMVFQMMDPIYKLIGWDIWTMPTVIVNKDRTSCLIRQNARWGTGDIFFLATYFEKVDVIKAEVKRFKHLGAVLTDGTVLKDIRHVLKCLGFSGDFAVDRLMKTTQHVGLYPDGDWRRTVYAEFLQIDAGRFSGTAFGPGGASVSMYVLWYFQHPADAFRLVMSNLLPTNKANPDAGKPAYDWPARAGSLAMMQMSGNVAEISDWESVANNPFKKASLWYLAYPERHVRECTEDWEKYCQLMTDQGSTKPWPPYPYSAQDLHNFARMDEELNPAGQTTEAPVLPPSVAPGSAESFGPAMSVLKARGRSMSPKPEQPEVESWLREARQQVLQRRLVCS